jgi:hypothetical protein
MDGTGVVRDSVAASFGLSTGGHTLGSPTVAAVLWTTGAAAEGPMRACGGRRRGVRAVGPAAAAKRLREDAGPAAVRAPSLLASSLLTPTALLVAMPGAGGADADSPTAVLGDCSICLTRVLRPCTLDRELRSPVSCGRSCPSMRASVAAAAALLSLASSTGLPWGLA